MKIVVVVSMPDEADVEQNVREVMDELHKTVFYIKDYELNKFPHLTTRVFCNASVDVAHPGLIGGLTDGTKQS